MKLADRAPAAAKWTLAALLVPVVAGLALTGGLGYVALHFLRSGG